MNHDYRKDFFPFEKQHNVNMKSTVDSAKDNKAYQQKSGRGIINKLSIFHKKQSKKQRQINGTDQKQAQI